MDIALALKNEPKNLDLVKINDFTESYFHASINADIQTVLFSCQGLSLRDHYQALNGKLAIKIRGSMEWNVWDVQAVYAKQRGEVRK